MDSHTQIINAIQIVNLIALALHEPYTAFNSVIIGDGISLSIANIDSFTLPSLPTPLLFTNVLHVPAMSTNLILSLPFVPISLLMSCFFYSFFQVQDRHTGVTLVRG